MPLTHIDPLQQKIRATVSLVLGELPAPLTLDERTEIAVQVPTIALALALRVKDVQAQGRSPKLLLFSGPDDFLGLVWFEDGFVPGGTPGRVEDLAAAISYLSTTSPLFRQAVFQLHSLAATDRPLPVHRLPMGQVISPLMWITREQPTFPRTAAMLRRKQALEAEVKTCCAVVEGQRGDGSRRPAALR